MKILLYDNLRKTYIAEESNEYGENLFKFSKGYLEYNWNKYGFNDVINNVTGIDLWDIFSEIITTLEPNKYSPSKASLERCLLKAKSIAYELTYNYPFYVDTIAVDLSQEYLNKQVDEKDVKEYIRGKFDCNETKHEYIKGYLNLYTPQKIYGVFPSRDAYGRDCIYIAYKCDFINNS